MSERGEVQASVSRGRPPGSRRSQQAACTPEDSGMSRSTRSRSNSIPTLPTEAVDNRRSRKVSKKEESTSGKQSATSRKPGTSGRKLSAHGGEADLGEEGWGVQRARESLSTYGSRVMSHLREYEEASKSLRRLREELRYARARANQATKKKKSEIQAEVKRLEMEIKDLEERKAEIREMSGGFKEKLINDDRFREMADNRERRLMGLQPESQVDDDDDDDDDNNDEMDEDQQPDPPGSLQQHQQAPYSGPPAQQPVVTPADSGEDSDSSGQGGALMAQIRMIESPLCPQNFVFGDELPEEAPGGKKGKTKAKQQEVRPPGWVEATGSSIHLSWKKRK
ncbi:uncharacterized protein DDB_G0287625-like [Dendropsophus ebraccatus]|uniref:uncharacterized protein DDB_G0287625-like n=1 Tax=Dendropsophus ebraccatus TaxID=150705 RepID=UPI00383192AB